MARGDAKVLVGCCGWPCTHRAYYQRFRAIEIQSTFYRLPKLETATKWRREAPEEFVFTFKAFQGITHLPTSPTWRRSGIRTEELRTKKFGWLRPTSDNLEAWRGIMEVGELLRAEVCVVQCPPNFNCTSENVENMWRFFRKAKRGRFEIAWEPRGDWGKHPDVVRRLCKELNLIHCVDPLRAEPLHFGSKKIAYFRLHGFGKPSIYNYRFSDEELRRIAEVVDGLRRKTKRIYCFFNNVAMLEDASKFGDLLECFDSK